MLQARICGIKIISICLHKFYSDVIILKLQIAICDTFGGYFIFKSPTVCAVSGAI